MARRRRILLALSSLGCGGAERSAARLAAGLAERGHAVALATLASAVTDFHPLDPRVRRFDLGLARPSRNPLRALLANRGRILALREAMRASEAELAISFIPTLNVLTGFAARRLGIPVIACERNDPRMEVLARPWRRLSRRAYRRADLVVANSKSVAEWMERELGPGRVQWIPNAVELASPRSTEPEVALPRAPFVLSVGRLEPQKDHGTLLRAFAHAAALPGWHLVIAGEGRLRSALESSARELGIAARTHLVGPVRDVPALLARASIFAFPSRHEGFPNALAEAMSAGLACVATHTGAGASELLVDGESGILVPIGDAGALARALEHLAADPGLSARLGAAARAAIEPFAPEAILGAWEEAIARVPSRART